jgi:hypothetical protein
MVCFGVDGVVVFEGKHKGMFSQLKDMEVFHMVGVHCVAHRTNLVIKILSFFPMVSRSEGWLQNLHACFS